MQQETDTILLPEELPTLPGAEQNMLEELQHKRELQRRLKNVRLHKRSVLQLQLPRNVPCKPKQKRKLKLNVRK